MSPTLEAMLKPYAQPAGKLISTTPMAITQRYRRLCKKLGIQGRFHDLRAYHCSMMVASGAAPEYIMRDMGHATDNLYRRVYTHLRDDAQAAINEEMDRRAAAKFAKSDTTCDTKQKEPLQHNDS